MTTRILGSLTAAALTLSLAATAHADINGFGNFSGFTINQSDTGSPPTSPAPGAIQLVNANSESRSIFANTPQDITGFTASFTYLPQSLRNFSGGTGATFVIEDDPRGAAALSPVGTDNFGYTGITHSVGIVFDFYYNSTGLFTNGTIGVGEASMSPINLQVSDPLNVQLNYSGSTLVENVTDTVTLQTFSKTYLVLTPFATTLGSSTGYVGIAAGGGDNNVQTFSNFQFVSVPEPASLSILGCAAAGLLGRRRRQTRMR